MTVQTAYSTATMAVPLRRFASEAMFGFFVTTPSHSQEAKT